jgi:uncharacterized protein (DUF58 family)
MVSKDIIKRVRRIQITTTKKVTDVFAGRYHSVFKGLGMEFDEVREYMPGDEIRSIDWNVTARMGHPYIKKFVEERELTIMLLLDTSMSCRFGTAGRLKSDLAAELASVFAFSAIQNNDRVGAMMFTDRVEKFIPPRKGSKHVLRVVREALQNKPAGTKTDLNFVLEHLNRVSKRRTIAFIISDFFTADFKKMLSVTNKRHDVIAVTINDPAEHELPNAGIVKLHDAETGERALVDTSNSRVRKSYAEQAQSVASARKAIFRSCKVDNIEISTDTSYIEPLMRFFKLRERRLVRGR